MRQDAKKVLLLLLTLVLFVSAVPVMAAEAPLEEIPILNAGFEEATEESNPGWDYMKDSVITVDTGYAKTGENSLKIDNNNNRNSWAAQFVPITAGMQPGAMYELGAWVSTDLVSPGGRGIGYKIEQYTAKGDYIDGADPSESSFNINTLRQWNYHSMFFQAHEEAASIKIYLRAYTPGIVWYDDITLKLSGGPEPYSYYADHVFHYPDEEEGNAYIYLDAYYAADSKEAMDVSGRFTFYDTDGATILDKKENVKFSGKEMKYTYPVSLMDEKQVRYQLKIELLDKTGAVIREWNENMYVYDRPLWFQEGRWTYNGERFDPIIAYHVGKGHVESLGNTFNTFQISYGYNSAKMDSERESYFESLDAAGKKALVCLYTDMKAAGHPDNLETTKRLVEMYKDDPRVFAWGVQDEPLGAGTNWENRKQWLEDSYRAIREIDPNHPVYLLDYNHHKETIKYCDVFVADVYVHGDTASGVSKTIEPLTEAFTRVPTYELGACYKQNGVFPSMKSARGSIYRGFEAGNSYGTGFYAISDAIGHDAGDKQASLETLDVWPEYVKLLSEEAPILFDYYAGYERKDFTSFNKYREGELHLEHLWETWFTDEGEMYLLAHNRSREDAEFNIPLVSANGKIRVGSYKAEPIGLTATGEKNGEGSISFTLTGEEAALYKITPSEKIDLSQIDAPMFDDLSGDYAWAAEAVAKTQALGIVNDKGEGVFAPAEAISRGDFAGFLIRTLGITNENIENFADVPAEREYAKEIAAGKALGILKGVGDNIFNPESAITRQDMMTIAARGMKLAQKLAAADASVLDGFHDKANVADYALESVSAMIKSGIIRGDDAGYLNPTGNTRRAEAAVIMERILNAEKVLEVTPSVPDAPKVENEVIKFAAPTAEALAKYNRAAALLKGLGTGDFNVETSITNGEAEAAVSAAIGIEFDAFGENHRALTTAKAVEEFVKLLGYESYVQRDGGYMGTAARLDLIKGVDVSSEYLRGGEFALLLENALGIHLADPAGYGGDSEGVYIETEDTLLTRFRHFTLYKGTLEQNENTELAKGKVTIGTNLLEVGNTDAKHFIGQRVEAYCEGEDNTIVFIRAHKNVKVTTVYADAINISETTLSKFVYEDEAGHQKSIAISGAKVLYNGKYKTNPSVNTIIPAQGTVTLIENSGTGADYILVEKYDNFIVDRIWAEDRQIFFKNRAEIIWDETDRAKRLSMEGGSYNALKEWNVISLYVSEDGSVMRAVVSTETAKGTVAEVSDDDINIGETAYKLADGVYGTIELGENYTFLLDATGNIAGINTESTVKNYAYLTTISQSKGIDGRVQMRVFTKDGEMKVLNVKETVQYNGTPTPATALLSNWALVADGNTVDQLIIMETTGKGEAEEITAFETARNGEGMADAERYNTFTYDFYTGGDAAKIRYDGHAARVIASKYIVHEDILLFVVPETTSDNLADYSVRKFGSFVHGNSYRNATLYDIDENLYIGAMVQKIENIADVGVSGTTGVVTRVGKAMNADGETVRTVTVMASGEKTLKFQTEEFRIVLGSKALTDLNKGETEYTQNVMGVKTVKEQISPDALNVGDVVMYTLKGGTTDVVSGMRVLLRGQSPATGEKSQEGMGEFYNYSQLTYAFGMVQRTVERGVLLTPAGYERLYVFEGNGTEAPVLLVEDGEVKKVTPEHIARGDMVYVQKHNPYQVITVIYR